MEDSLKMQEPVTENSQDLRVSVINKKQDLRVSVIENPQDLRVSIYGLSSEAKLKHIYEPAPGLFIVETPNVVLRALRSGYEAESFFLEERFLEPPEGVQEGVNNVWASVQEILQLAGNVPVFTADLNLISKVCGFKQSRGFLAAMKRKPLPAISDVLKGASRVVVLEDVENPANIGAIFRSAASLGMDAVLLTPGSSDPLYRRASRVSMGGAFQIPWTFIGNKYGGWPNPGLQELKSAGFKIAAMALTDDAVSLKDPALVSEEKLAVIFGNEQYGILPETLEQCDYIVQIPMKHEMDSLNVAAASAVAFWQLGK